MARREERRMRRRLAGGDSRQQLRSDYQQPFKDNGACIFGPDLEVGHQNVMRVRSNRLKNQRRRERVHSRGSEGEQCRGQCRREV